MQVHIVVSKMAAEFEEAVRLSGGWVDLALPSAEDAARYFASFRRTPPDNSALVPGPQVPARSQSPSPGLEFSRESMTLS